jgi:DNA-directed RNA polymerase specialized sigma24 family protein
VLKCPREKCRMYKVCCQPNMGPCAVIDQAAGDPQQARERTISADPYDRRAYRDYKELITDAMRVRQFLMAYREMPLPKKAIIALRYSGFEDQQIATLLSISRSSVWRLLSAIDRFLQ